MRSNSMAVERKLMKHKADGTKRDSVSWNEVSKQMMAGGFTRTAKQCRNRSSNDQDTKKGEWEHLDEFIVASEHAIRGSRWASTGRLIARGENAVKNHWNGIHKSNEMYRACSVLWHYAQQLAKHSQPRKAFHDAVETWAHVVPAVLAAAVIQEFKTWQLVNQPDSLAVQLPDPPVCPAGLSLSDINLEHFMPHSRYRPDAVASIKDSLTTLLAPSRKEPVRYAQKHTVDNPPAVRAKQPLHHEKTIPMATQEVMMKRVVDQITCPASPASPGVTVIRNLGQFQTDAGNSVHGLAEADMALSQHIQAGQVLMLGGQTVQVLQVCDMDSAEHMAPIRKEALPVMRGAPMLVQGHSMPITQMPGVCSQISLAANQAYNAFPTHASTVAGILSPSGPVTVINMLDPRHVSMMMSGFQYQEAAPLMAQGWSVVASVPAVVPSMREIAVPPPETDGCNWAAPAEVPQAYVAAPPQHWTADGLELYQSPTQPGTFFLAPPP